VTCFSRCAAGNGNSPPLPPPGTGSANTSSRISDHWRFSRSPANSCRRTHASLSRQAGIDPKLVADQLGHGLGVNLDVYTVAALDKRQDAVEGLKVRNVLCLGWTLSTMSSYVQLPKLAVIDLARVFRFET